MKTLAIQVLGLALLLSSNARADDLWESVFALGHPDGARRASARQALFSAGPEGFRTTLMAVRMLGDRAPEAVGAGLRCPMAWFPGGHRDAPLAAARLLGEMMAAEPELAVSLLGSTSPVERKLGLLGLAPDVPRLLEALEGLWQESDASVVEYAPKAIACAMALNPGDQTALEALLEAGALARDRRGEMQPPALCEALDADSAPVLDALVDGRARVSGWSSARVSGWSSQGDELSITVTMPGGAKVTLRPRCAIELYDAVSRRGNYLPELIMPFVESLGVEAGLRREALHRAERDVEEFPETGRNHHAARLVNAGGRSRHRVTYHAKDPFAQEQLLEAAARQNQPLAWMAIDQATFCRGDFGDFRRIELLGFVGTNEAATTAAELARRCPRARAAAVTALIRLGDRRAAEFLAGALEDPMFSRDALERALGEHLTRALGAELVRLSGREDRVGQGAREILAGLQRAGLLRP
jgi:hypothetical protein